jgi:hypothetical protein
MRYPLDDKYITYCIWTTPFTNEQRKRFTCKPKPKKVITAMNKVKPYMSDEEVSRYLAEYNESGFDDIPNWLRQELKVRQLVFKKRQPTDMEKWETVSDAREHRIVNKELTQEDYKDKYMKGKSITIIT